MLRDGASAVYGSDAVAGVINFILNKEFVGMEVGGQYGSPTRSGGGESWNAYVVGGWGTLAKDKFNVNASFAYSKEEALYGVDRDFASVGTRAALLRERRHRPGQHRGCVHAGHGVGGERHVAGGHGAARLGHQPGLGLRQPPRRDAISAKPSTCG